MAVVTKNIANLPESTSVASTDLFVKQTNAGVAQKITGANLATQIFRQWEKILDTTTTANVNYDEEIAVTYPAYTLHEVMFTLQRVSNGRTFATATCPIGQFAGAGLYAFGSFALFSDAANANNNMRINAVAIDKTDNKIEIAIGACSEAIKARVFVR